MKARPGKNSGQVVLEVTDSDDPLLAASSPATTSPFRIKKILVPVDFSDCSRKALRYALALAKEHQAAITLVHVISPPSYPVGEFGGLEYGNLVADMRVGGEKQLKEMARNDVGNAAPVDIRILSGAPATEVVETAKELDVDMIVVSTHGHTGLKHVLLGSVAEHVVRTAPCPVLVVREREHEILPG
jgi:nucleotide-binding universal stress UspA family protein